MTKKERWVAFREEQKLVNLIDSVVDSKGIDRSDFIREAIRKELASLSFLPEIQKKALGIKSADNLNQEDGSNFG
jgi:metal-responsive CopG/Arc/MetJ family transcriptional regulator